MTLNHGSLWSVETVRPTRVITDTTRSRRIDLLSNSRLAESVGAYGWPEGLECWTNDLSATDADDLRAELGLRHTAWKVLLDAEARRHVLVVERGYGSVAISLAADFERVYVATPDPHGAAVIKARVAHARLSNVAVVDWRSIPPGSLDAAVLYGLTESELIGPFFDALTRCFARRATVYVALPRSSVGNGLARVRRTLRRRFATVRTFAYRTNGGLGGVYELTPLTDRYDRGFRQTLSALAAPLRAPAFGLIASRQGHNASLLDLVVAEGERRLGSRVRPQRFFFANPFGVTLLAGPWVFRVPLSPQALERNKTNFAALRALTRALPPGSVPEAILAGTVNGQRFFVERTLPGRAATAEVLDEAVRWIERLHATTACRLVLDATTVRRLVLAPMSHLRFVLGRGEHRALLDHVERYLVRTLTRDRMSLVFSHGDFAFDNILVKHGRITGVFDWDVSQRYGLPLLDLLYLLATWERAVGGDARECIWSRIFSRRFSPPAEAALSSYSLAMDVPDRLYQPLALMTWVHHMAVRTFNPDRYRIGTESGEVSVASLTAVRRMLDSIEPDVLEGEA